MMRAVARSYANAGKRASFEQLVEPYVCDDVNCVCLEVSSGQDLRRTSARSVCVQTNIAKEYEESERVLGQSAVSVWWRSGGGSGKNAHRPDGASHCCVCRSTQAAIFQYPFFDSSNPLSRAFSSCSHSGQCRKHARQQLSAPKLERRG